MKKKKVLTHFLAEVIIEDTKHHQKHKFKQGQKRTNQIHRKEKHSTQQLKNEGGLGVTLITLILKKSTFQIIIFFIKKKKKKITD